MKKTYKALSGCPWMLQSALFAILLLVLAIGAKAQTYTLSVAGSSLQVNTTTGGLSDWVVQGADQLALQSFYYSLGTTEYPISQISAPSAPIFTGSSSFGFILTTNISVTYANSELSLTTSYELAAMGGGTAGLQTSLAITNTSSTAETLQFYQLSDFTLGGVSSGQTVQFGTTNYPFSVTQTGPGTTLNGSLNGTSLGTAVSVEEIAGTSNFGLGNGNPAPNFDDSPLGATGSVEYAYEFTVNLPADSGVLIGELQTVPEPSTLTLVMPGGLALGLLYRRRLVSFKKLFKKASL